MSWAMYEMWDGGGDTNTTNPYSAPLYEVRRQGFRWVACEVDLFRGKVKVVGGPWLSKKRAAVALEIHKALKG